MILGFYMRVSGMGIDINKLFYEIGKQVSKILKVIIENLTCITYCDILGSW